MNSIRVRHQNGDKFAAALIKAGYQAQYLGAGTASTATHNGCSDHGCCSQHESIYDRKAWGAIKTNANGTQAHKIFESSR
jgi:hypothetical protein